MEQDRTRTSSFFVEGMCCADEEFTIRKKLGSLDGVDSCAFNLVAQRLTVTHRTNDAQIIKALREVGFKALMGSEGMPASQAKTSHVQLYFALSSGVLTLIGGIFLHLGSSPDLTTALFACAILLSGWRIALKGFKAARTFVFDMNFLMTLAVIGAMVIGRWEEAAVVTFLFAFALQLEAYSMEKTRNAIQSLMDLSPVTARVVQDGNEAEVPVAEVSIGEHVLVKPGERIPLDGEVISGSSFVNQSPITGESTPVEKWAGAQVFAGSINGKGSFVFRVTKLAQDTTLAHIIHLVEEAQSRRAPSQSFVDRFSRIYTPSVIGVGVLLSLVPPLLFGQPFEVWFYRSLVLLVIACPCALVISTPVTIVSGLTNAARNGILIKGGVHLENTGALKVVAFDKTGTLTLGTPVVTDVLSLNKLSTKEIIALAAAIESHSEHHLGAAIVRYAKQQDIPYEKIILERFEALTGKGVRALLNGRTFYLGSHALAEEQRICSPVIEEKLRGFEQGGKTTIILGTQTEAIGILAVSDEVRRESKDAVKALHESGIEKVVMLTGDNRGTAKAIADELGIDTHEAELLPDQKLEAIHSLRNQYGSVGMVGDGINDGPALAASTVGIAMGTAGSDVALETADIALMSDDLSKLSYTISLSRETVRVIKQNVILSLLIKLLFLALAIPGLATLWMAIAADEGVSLLVTFNAMRILRMKGRK
jgi:Cd2+/Zn2+-exporting ATPase